MSLSKVNSPKIVIFSGAGLSAPSGLATFRDSGGLWENYRIEDVATPQAWERNPGLVLDFYNQRRARACVAIPNAGHHAIAELESRFEVVVITQNVDDLHERAGSTRIIHLHGELTKARSSTDFSFISEIGAQPIQLGDLCPKGGQMLPHIVWFGEEVQNMEVAREHFLDADKVLVVGTSLSVYPAAGLLEFARRAEEKVLVSLEVDCAPDGFRVMRGSADEVLPLLARAWCAGAGK